VMELKVTVFLMPMIPWRLLGAADAVAY
jgi:hypothetical protein